MVDDHDREAVGALQLAKVAEYGGHVYVRYWPDGSNFILPICPTHNKQGDLECVRCDVTNVGSWWMGIRSIACIRRM